MPLDLCYRTATPRDADVLARMNAQLIRDEGHRNPMSASELETRMRGWLESEYEAVLFEQEDEPVGYALYRKESDHIYLRQLFVVPGRRRSGIGRQAIVWLRENRWASAACVRLDVLVGNETGRAFWRAVGFDDYCVTMEWNR